MTIIIDDDGIAHKVITASEYQQILEEILHLQTYVFWEGDELKVERDEVINIIRKHKGEQA